MKFFLLLVFFFVFPLVYAEQSISLDKTSYTTNDLVKISGKLSYQDGSFVIIQIRSQSDIVAIDQFTPSRDGTLSKTFVAQGPKWQESGVYSVIVTYGGIKYEKTFDFTPAKSSSVSSDEITQKLPTWVKLYAKKWHDGDISDRQFLAGISELIKEDFVNVDEKYIQENDDTRETPEWFKNTANWYSQGLITDDDYFLALEFLIKERFLII